MSLATYTGNRRRSLRRWWQRRLGSALICLEEVGEGETVKMIAYCIEKWLENQVTGPCAGTLREVKMWSWWQWDEEMKKMQTTFNITYQLLLTGLITYELLPTNLITYELLRTNLYYLLTIIIIIIYIILKNIIIIKLIIKS